MIRWILEWVYCWRVIGRYFTKVNRAHWFDGIPTWFVGNTAIQVWQTGSDQTDSIINQIKRQAKETLRERLEGRGSGVSE